MTPTPSPADLRPAVRLVLLQAIHRAKRQHRPTARLKRALRAATLAAMGVRAE